VTTATALASHVEAWIELHHSRAFRKDRNLLAMQYFVEPNADKPVWLARVDSPTGVAERIIPADPIWRQFNSMRSLPFDSTGIEVTPSRAAEIAFSWNSALP